VLGLAATADSARYTFLLRDGRSVERTLKAHSFLEAPPLVRLAADKAQPWVSQEPNEPFRMRDAPELDSLVVQLRQTSDNGSNRVLDFLQRAEARRSDLGRSNIVLDMRANGGGDLLLVRDFMIAWPSKVPGRILVLQGTRTGSAAIASIAYLEQAGGEKVILVGGPPGDRLMFLRRRQDDRAASFHHRPPAGHRAARLSQWLSYLHRLHRLGCSARRPDRCLQCDGHGIRQNSHIREVARSGHRRGADIEDLIAGRDREWRPSPTTFARAQGTDR
jgi:hypothetical protein